MVNHTIVRHMHDVSVSGTAHLPRCDGLLKKRGQNKKHQILAGKIGSTTLNTHTYTHKRKRTNRQTHKYTNTYIHTHKYTHTNLLFSSTINNYTRLYTRLLTLDKKTTVADKKTTVKIVSTRILPKQFQLRLTYTVHVGRQDNTTL